MKLIEPLYSVFLVCNEVMIIHQVYNELSTITVTSFDKLLYVSKKKKYDSFSSQIGLNSNLL